MSSDWFPGKGYIDFIGSVFWTLAWPFQMLNKLLKKLLQRIFRKSSEKKSEFTFTNQNSPNYGNTTQYQSAYEWICGYGDQIDQNGTQSFSSQYLQKAYGLTEESSGTYTGTTYFSDGTALGLTIGRSSDGTVYPHLSCVIVRWGETELARIDWNENAKRNRDKWVHLHILGSRNHRYFDEWEESKQILNDVFEDLYK